MSLEHPEKFGVIPELRNILGIKEDRSHWPYKIRSTAALCERTKNSDPYSMENMYYPESSRASEPLPRSTRPDYLALHDPSYNPAPERPMTWDVDKTHLRNLELAIDRSEDPLSCSSDTPQKGLIPRWVTAQLANAVHAAQYRQSSPMILEDHSGASVAVLAALDSFVRGGLMSPDFAYVFTPPHPFRVPPTTNDTAPVPAGGHFTPTEEAHYAHAYIAAEVRTFYSPTHNLWDPGRARHGPGADHNDDIGLESVSDPEEVDVVGDGDVSSTSHAVLTSSHGISNSSHIAASAFSHTHAHPNSSNSTSTTSSSARSEEVDTEEDAVVPITRHMRQMRVVLPVFRNTVSSARKGSGGPARSCDRDA
ncbi:hypothetical protein B0H11DRAFT_2238817 [Mycena galericulata]|nr:hypothetical protein B0H11DRAFT_2238817 [Mycena galericulata]